MNTSTESPRGKWGRERVVNDGVDDHESAGSPRFDRAMILESAMKS
jgi:hypothetical protein